MKPQISFCMAPDGARLACAVMGEGPLLVYPPAWVSHVELFLEDPVPRPFFERLARHHRVLLYDRRGVGLSERRRSDFSLGLDLADLEAVIDCFARGDETVRLLGTSMGGPLAIAYAAAHPERVERLVLYGSYSSGSRVASTEVRESLIGLVRAHWGMGSQALTALFVPEPSSISPEAHAFLGRLQRESARPEMAARLLEALFETDVDALLPGVRVPTQVVARRGDRAVVPRLGRDLAAAIPGATLTLLDGDVHVPWLGDIGTLLDAIEPFLGVHAPRQAPDHGRVPAAVPERPSYRVVHQVLTGGESAQDRCRVALAQIGQPEDVFTPRGDGMYGLPAARVKAVLDQVEGQVEEARRRRADVLLIPELLADLEHPELRAGLERLAREAGLYLVPGAYHDAARRMGVCRVLGPEGPAWEQPKYIPATLKLAGKRVVEPIRRPAEGVITVASTRVGRMAVVICRDFLDLDVRVALRNAEPPVDVVLNPAFTPVTADFAAAHLESRRSIYAACLFCNVATFGGSRITSPEKRRQSQVLGPGRTGLLVQELDLSTMRAERARWAEHSHERFIQSTR